MCRKCRTTTSTASAGRAGGSHGREAFTFVSPEEEENLRDIERAIGRRLPRVTAPDFDYQARPKQRLEIPVGQRIAEIRTRKREERARQAVNQARRAAAGRGQIAAPRGTTHHEG